MEFTNILPLIAAGAAVAIVILRMPKRSDIEELRASYTIMQADIRNFAKVTTLNKEIEDLRILFRGTCELQKEIETKKLDFADRHKQCTDELIAYIKHADDSMARIRTILEHHENIAVHYHKLLGQKQFQVMDWEKLNTISQKLRDFHSELEVILK